MKKYIGRELILTAYYNRRHLICLEKGDINNANKWLDKINKLKEYNYYDA